MSGSIVLAIPVGEDLSHALSPINDAQMID
jgi:hypothetical protein